MTDQFNPLEDASVLLKEASANLSWAAQEIQRLRQENDKKDRLIESIKIAAAMPPEMRGGEGEVEYGEKLASSNEDLSVLRKAMEFSTTKRTKLASVSDDLSLLSDGDSPYSVPAGHASKNMEAWLLSSTRTHY